MTNKGLQMPANYVALNNEELSCVDAGGVIAQVCYAFGTMFRNFTISNWESESKKNEEAHGAVVSKVGNVYTYSDGYEHTMSGGSSFSYTIGDFFYGIGDLFNIFGL